MEVFNWVLVGLVCAFIVACPIMYQIFGKEDGCGRSLFDRWKNRKNNAK